jgi:BRCA1-associated protein
VCRYTQIPDFSTDSVCAECGSGENLWLCLICGYIGCGRYVRGHAYSHFQLTQHTYSMQLGSNRVWDYAGDNYVHRLIQNKTDGKMVRFDEAGRVINQDEKVDSITLEYTYLLTLQLESQRTFFEERLLKQEEKSQEQIQELDSKAKSYEKENEKLKDSVENLSKDKATLEKRCTLLTTKLNKLQSSLEEEQQINKCMTSNQNAYLIRLNEMEEKFKKSDKEKTSVNIYSGRNIKNKFFELTFLCIGN